MSPHYSIPELIDRTRLSAFQWRVFGLCFFVAILDGFDTQAIAFTGPSIIQAFGLGAGALAPILTAGIVGMVLGAMALGLMGDKFGRRPTIIGSVALFGVASLATAFAQTTELLRSTRCLLCALFHSRSCYRKSTLGYCCWPCLFSALFCAWDWPTAAATGHWYSSSPAARTWALAASKSC